jgi:hypothetical protein
VLDPYAFLIVAKLESKEKKKNSPTYDEFNKMVVT